MMILYDFTCIQFSSEELKQLSALYVIFMIEFHMQGSMWNSKHRRRLGWLETTGRKAESLILDVTAVING